MRKVKNIEKALSLVEGTSYKGQLIGFGYSELVDLMGEPTFTTSSGDDKVQKEWVIVDGKNVFTIYDWKTYNKQYTMHELKVWHIGGKTSPYEFIDKMYSKLNAKITEKFLSGTSDACIIYRGLNHTMI
jgi:hypothetical protein